MGRPADPRRNADRGARCCGDTATLTDDAQFLGRREYDDLVGLCLRRVGECGRTPVRIELICPPHIAGVIAEPVTVDGSESAVALTLRFDEELLGPFNMPLTLRATTQDESGYLVVAEDDFEIAR